VALKKATFCFIVKVMKYFIITFGCQMNLAPEQGSGGASKSYAIPHHNLRMSDEQIG
jgi:hypothetical protein